MSVTQELIWSEIRPPNKEHNDTHVVADCALGQFRIEWRAHKGREDFLTGNFVCTDEPTIHLEFRDIGQVVSGEIWIDCKFNLEDAKIRAQEFYDELILKCLKPEYRDTIHIMHTASLAKS